MTEKEKAKAGYLYNANYDSEIVNEIEPATNCQNPSPKIADKSTPINKTNDETKIAFVGT